MRVKVDFDFEGRISIEDIVIKYLQDVKDASDNDRPSPVVDKTMKKR
jgi:hypothetical protein